MEKNLPIFAFISRKYNPSIDNTAKLAEECIATFCNKNNIPHQCAITIWKDSWGKPHPNIEGVYLSISHSSNCWICVVSSFPVGVDIEKRSALINMPLLRRLGNYASLDPSPITLWTKIESCSKLIGKGLTVRLDELIAYVENGCFSFVECFVDNDYICTICFCKRPQYGCHIIKYPAAS